jgi:hypothetical protein
MKYPEIFIKAFELAKNNDWYLSDTKLSIFAYTHGNIYMYDQDKAEIAYLQNGREEIHSEHSFKNEHRELINKQVQPIILKALLGS